MLRNPEEEQLPRYANLQCHLSRVFKIPSLKLFGVAHFQNGFWPIMEALPNSKKAARESVPGMVWSRPQLPPPELTADGRGPVVD